MKLTVAAVGRLRPALFEPAAAEYSARLQRYATLRVAEVKEVSSRSPAEAVEAESQALLAAAKGANHRVVLDARGELLTSAALAKRLENALQFGPDHWAFFVGGSHGHSAALLSSASWTWSLGPMTLPHELARVVLLEQLYRAFTIIRGEPYHK